jgi:formylmethanofuran--tetrahydromethanopterin N-formyltransferase
LIPHTIQLKKYLIEFQEANLTKKILIQNTFAEAFPMKASRLIITAYSKKWALEAANSFTGFATSVIACGCEAGIESILKKSETPDGRPGVSILVFSMSENELAKQILNRAGQCVMTSPTSALYAGNLGEKKINLGNSLRYFGDGFQISKLIGEKRLWRIPVMDGEFLCEEFAYQMKAIGGGNFLILGESIDALLKVAEKAVSEMNKIKNIILPFPGGIVRSGSKVGSKYKNLIASTNFEYCPSLRGLVKSKLDQKSNYVLEIVIDGISEDDIKKAMRVGINSIVNSGSEKINAISAGNYGGKLGPYLFYLKKIML